LNYRTFLEQLEEDEDVGAVVITGSEKAFAAGADIKAMKTGPLWMFIKPTSLRKHGKGLPTSESQSLQR
jgi:enoyl-CoA hydratase/carnithine racemase